MMVSPENVYEELKCKSDKEVLLELRKFKQRIVQLKKELEFPNVEEIVVGPSPLVQIKCIRNYIEECKRILKERGVEYKPTQTEQRTLDFNARLRANADSSNIHRLICWVQKLYFNIGRKHAKCFFWCGYRFYRDTLLGNSDR